MGGVTIEGTLLYILIYYRVTLAKTRLHLGGGLVGPRLLKGRKLGSNLDLGQMCPRSIWAAVLTDREEYLTYPTPREKIFFLGLIVKSRYIFPFSVHFGSHLI